MLVYLACVGPALLVIKMRISSKIILPWEEGMRKCPSLPIKWISVIVERAGERDLNIGCVLLARGSSLKLEVGDITPGFKGIRHYILDMIGIKGWMERWVILDASRKNRDKLVTAYLKGLL